MTYDYIIIGGGVMGCAAAYYLSKKNKKILVVDQFSMQNDMNASQDFSKMFRYEYGSDIFYTKLAVDSLKQWKKIEKEYGQLLYFPCGELLIAKKERDKEYAMESYKALKKLGYKTTLFTKNTLEEKFPQFDSSFGVFDYHAGILEASKAVKAFVQIAKKNGVTFWYEKSVRKIKGTTVYLKNNKSIEGKCIIVTAGIWTEKLISEKLPITITKQDLLYFQPQKKENFVKAKFPAFAYLDRGFYGFPIHGIDAVKIAAHAEGKKINITNLDRNISKNSIKKTREFLKSFIPQLARAKIIKKKVCFYDMTPDEDFIIDKVNPTTVIGVGFSGHGFKFAPVIGKLLAELALGKKKLSWDINRFRMQRFVTKEA